jgi:hypothetical protein
MTGGSGGALLLRGDWAGRADALRLSLQAGTRGTRETVALGAQWVLGRPGLYSIPSAIPALGLGEMIYKPAGPPADIAASAVNAALVSLVEVDREVRFRRERARELRTALADSSSFEGIEPAAGGEPGYLRFAMLDRTGDAKPEHSLGVLRGYPITLDEHPETRKVLAGTESLDGARHLRDRLYTAPTHSLVSDGDARRIAAWLRGR